jgi:hypothetical protein
MAAAIGAAAFQQDAVIRLLFGSKELAVLVVALAGSAVYAVAALALGAVRPSEVRAALRREQGPALPSGEDG